MTVFGKTNWLERKSIIAYTRKYSLEDANGMNKKKCVLLEDETFGWLQICTVASLVDVKGNKARK